METKKFKLNRLQELAIIITLSFMCVVGTVIGVAYAKQIDQALYNFVNWLAK